MGQLADRLGELLRAWGSDPASRGSELDAFAALEARDEAAAQAKFAQLRHQFALQRHAELRAALARLPFVRDAPRDAPAGAREVEREIGWLDAAMGRARRVEASLAEGARLHAQLAARRYTAEPPLEATAWDQLAPLEEEAESRRRKAAREARVEARALDVTRRARKLRERVVALPPTDTMLAAEADAALADAEAALSLAEKAEASFGRVMDALRAPDVIAWRAESRKALESAAKQAVALPDAADARRALDALTPKADALRVEAAKLASEAARSRRSGRAAPPSERRSTDVQDGYG